MFEALILVEEPNDVGLVLVDFQTLASGSTTRDIGPFSINGMGNSDVFDPVTGDILLTITTDQVLDPDDENVIDQFELSSLAVGDRTVSETAIVILYEIGM